MALTVTIRFRATRKDERALARLAKFYDRTPSDVLRRLIEEAEARIQPRERVAPPKKEDTDHGSEAKQ
ncbi:MAG TPA: hypothetical protein VFE26_10860 [Trebonia sp.]|jgi:hypothetical protein|nr:hypothetical protein [Trebonia sp.]